MTITLATVTVWAVLLGTGFLLGMFVATVKEFVDKLAAVVDGHR